MQDQYRSMLLESVRLHRRLSREWARLAGEYRAALPSLTSPESWRAAFEEVE